MFPLNHLLVPLHQFEQHGKRNDSRCNQLCKEKAEGDEGKEVEETAATEVLPALEQIPKDEFKIARGGLHEAQKKF